MVIPTPTASKGFTLIEILIVVAILSIITGLAVAALHTSMKDSKLQSEKATAKVLNEALIRADIKNDSEVAAAIANGDGDMIIDILFEKGYVD